MKDVNYVKDKVYKKEYVRPEDFVCLSNAVLIYQKLVRELNNFVDEHKLFKERFIFNAEEQYTRSNLEFQEL